MKESVHFQSGIEALKLEPKNKVNVTEKKEGRKLSPPGHLVQPQSPLMTTIMPGESSDHLTRLLRESVLPYPFPSSDSSKVRGRINQIGPAKLRVFQNSKFKKFDRQSLK